MEEMEMRLRRRLAITIVCFIVQFVMVMWLNIANHRAVVSLIEAQCGGESAKAVESETEAEKPVDGSDGIIAGVDIVTYVSTARMRAVCSRRSRIHAMSGGRRQVRRQSSRRNVTPRRNWPEWRWSSRPRFRG